MTMTFRQGTEEYYQKFIELQEKLRKSEEERLVLEMKFNEMMQVTREEEQTYYKKLRSQYKQFLEENRKRQERNERILRLLERVESRASMLEAKTQRIQFLRRQYHNYLDRISAKNQNNNNIRSVKNLEKGYESNVAKIRDDGGYNERRGGDNASSVGYNLKRGGDDDQRRGGHDESMVGYKAEIEARYNPRRKSVFDNIYGSRVVDNNLKPSAGCNYSRDGSQKSLPGSNTDLPPTFRLDHDFERNNGASHTEDFLRKYNQDEPKKYDNIPGNDTRDYLKKFDDSYLKDDYSYTKEEDEAYYPQKSSTIAEEIMHTIDRRRRGSIYPTPRLSNSNLEGGNDNQSNSDTDSTAGAYAYKPDRGKLRDDPSSRRSVSFGDDRLTDRSVDKETRLPQIEGEARIVKHSINEQDKLEFSIQAENKISEENGLTTQSQNLKSDEEIISESNVQSKPEKVVQLLKTNDVPLEAGLSLQDIPFENKKASHETIGPVKDYQLQTPQQHDDNESDEMLGKVQSAIAEDRGESLEGIKSSQEHEVKKVQQQKVNDGNCEMKTSEQHEIEKSEGIQKVQQGAVDDGKGEKLDGITKSPQPEVDIDNADSQENQPDNAGNQQSLEENPKASTTEQTNVDQIVNIGQLSDKPEDKSDDNGKINQNEEHISVPEILQGNNLEDVGRVEYTDVQYDANGHLIQYDENGQVLQYYQPEFDENGQPIHYDNGGQQLQYDENGQPLQMEQQYDSNGQPIQYDGNGQPIQYDENGQPIQYDGNGQHIQYDENGQPIPYDPNSGKIQYDQNSQEIQYDENGQPIQYESTHYSTNEQPIQYDSNNQPIQYDENNQPLQYDQNNPPVQYDPNNQPIHYDVNNQPIQYDSKNQPLQYDANNQPIQYNENNQPIHYDSNNQPIQYDENNQPIRYDENNQPIQYNEHNQPIHYDSNNQPIQYDENNQPIQYGANQYDNNGIPFDQPQEMQYDNSNQQYDENGQLIQYDENGELISYYPENYSGTHQEETDPSSQITFNAKEDEKKQNVLDLLETDTESGKQDTNKVSNDSDFDFSNAT